MNSKTVCQLCTDDQRQYRSTIVKIDGLDLCYEHAGEYLHQAEYPSSSIHRKKFDKLLIIAKLEAI